ncbi:MAG: outer membrane lipoprotein carrier protein LolA, partial [Chthoniobacterales bacterium]
MTKNIAIFSRNSAGKAGLAVIAENNQSRITNHQSRFVPAHLRLGREGARPRAPRSPIVVLLITVFFASVLHAAPLSQDEITNLVQRLETVYQNRTSLQANFREERHVAILKEPVINVGKIWFTPPDMIRREITGNSPSTTVIDGKTMTIYYPNLKTAEQYDLVKRPIIRQSLEALTAGLNFQRVSDYYSIEGTKDGDTYMVTLTPKTAAIRRLVKSLTLTMKTDLTPEKV